MHSAAARALRDHVVGALPLEYVRIRQVERLGQDDAFVAPLERVSAYGETDLTFAREVVDDLEKEIPLIAVMAHERIRDERCGHIGDVFVRQHRIGTRSRLHREWRVADDNSDGELL